MYKLLVRSLFDYGNLIFYITTRMFKQTLSNIHTLVLNYVDKLWVFHWMGTNCALLVTDLFSSVTRMYERDFMSLFLKNKGNLKLLKLSARRQVLDDLLNIDNNYFDGLICQIYPSELRLNKTIFYETEAPFVVHLSTTSSGWAIVIAMCPASVIRRSSSTICFKWIYSVTCGRILAKVDRIVPLDIF